MVILAPDKGVLVSVATTFPVTVNLGCCAMLVNTARNSIGRRSNLLPMQQGKFSYGKL
jgi:hypothetical protein